MITAEIVMEICDFLKEEQKHHEDNGDFISEDALLWGYDMTIEDIENHFLKENITN